MDISLKDISQARKHLDFLRVLPKRDMDVLNAGLDALEQNADRDLAKRKLETAKNRFLNSPFNQKAVSEGMADADVLQFIADFGFCYPDRDDVLHNLFASGYCLYFAHMLKTAFGRGRIVIAAPYEHIVWEDENETAYGIDGICYEYDVLIPIEELGDGIEDFMHVPGRNGFCTPEQIKEIMRRHGHGSD